MGGGGGGGGQCHLQHTGPRKIALLDEGGGGGGENKNQFVM